MTFSDGFADLRLNRSADQTSESFWPSFTDVMTVIVMIFLLAMVVLLLRNLELVSELRATMESERRSAALAQATGEERESLALRLADAENEISHLQLQLLRLEEQRREQHQNLLQQQARIRELGRENETLRAERQAKAGEAASLNEELDAAARRIEALRQSQAQLEARYGEAGAELERLRESGRARDEELATTLVRLRDADLALAELQGDYSRLQVKYDRLVRPARSPRGRHLVEVRYARVGGDYRIDYREPTDPGFTPVSRAELDQRLARLRADHPEGLYVKIIFPEDSGLSYSEAWRFTNELHRRYDYYYQERGGEGTEAPAQ